MGQTISNSFDWPRSVVFGWEAKCILASGCNLRGSSMPISVKKNKTYELFLIVANDYLCVN